MRRSAPRRLLPTELRSYELSANDDGTKCCDSIAYASGYGANCEASGCDICKTVNDAKTECCTTAPMQRATARVVYSRLKTPVIWLPLTSMLNVVDVAAPERYNIVTSNTQCHLAISPSDTAVEAGEFCKFIHHTDTITLKPETVMARPHTSRNIIIIIIIIILIIRLMI